MRKVMSKLKIFKNYDALLLNLSISILNQKWMLRIKKLKHVYKL